MPSNTITGIFFIAVGLFTLAMTLLKPSFYWNSRRAKRLRGLLGDGITTIFYIIIAILCIFYGVKVL